MSIVKLESGKTFEFKHWIDAVEFAEDVERYGFTAVVLLKRGDDEQSD